MLSIFQTNIQIYINYYKRQPKSLIKVTQHMEMFLTGSAAALVLVSRCFTTNGSVSQIHPVGLFPANTNRHKHCIPSHIITSLTHTLRYYKDTLYLLTIIHGATNAI